MFIAKLRGGYRDFPCTPHQHIYTASPIIGTSGAELVVKNLLDSAGDAGDVSSIPGSERSPGEENGYPLQILAWGIPWTEEPGGLQSMGLQESDRTEQLNHHPSPRARFSSLP